MGYHEAVTGGGFLHLISKLFNFVYCKNKSLLKGLTFANNDCVSCSCAGVDVNIICQCLASDPHVEVIQLSLALFRNC